ncbi:MAG: hypothetical protein GY745_05795 [Actinomycetia bacterium]|nr:hypothetical protein [Actinomycetes bacterium]
MAANRTTFEKLQRDRAKKAKAAAKREKRLGRTPDPEEVEEAPAPMPVSDGGELSPGELLRAVEVLHREYADKKIDLDTFEERKADLMARIPVD